MNKKNALFSFLLFTILCFIPLATMAKTITPTNKDLAEQKNKQPSKITIEREKIEEGIYRFSFSSDTNNISENDKTTAFLEELATFKKEHSGEKITGYQPIFNNNPVSISGYIVSTEKTPLNGTVMAALIGAAIAMISLYYTRKHNRKTLFVENITSERVKWMGQLKEYVAEFISLVSFYNEKPILKDAKEKGEFLDKVIHTQSKIQLHLNYKDETDIEIMQLVEKMTKNVMNTYEIFTLLKQSDKEKIAYVLEKHKEQLNNRILLKIEQMGKETSTTNNFLDIKSALKTIENIVRESKREEIQIFNNQFKKEFATLKQELQSDTKTLSGLTQEYLKEEWNRVKLEAEKGNISKDKFDIVKTLKKWIPLKK